MKRPLAIGLFGIAGLTLGYVAFPSIFERLLRPAEPKHIDVSTAKVAAIHISTSDPKISLLVFENDGVVSVSLTKGLLNDDYVDFTVRAEAKDPEIEMSVVRKADGIVSILKKSDGEGIPTKKAVSSAGAFRSFVRKDIEWVEVNREREKPNQPPVPTRGNGT
jgi:hypothetical protein